MSHLHAHVAYGVSGLEQQFGSCRLVDGLLAAVVADARRHARMTTIALPRSGVTVAFPRRVLPREEPTSERSSWGEGSRHGWLRGWAVPWSAFGKATTVETPAWP